MEEFKHVALEKFYFENRLFNKTNRTKSHSRLIMVPIYGTKPEIVQSKSNLIVWQRQFKHWWKE